MKSAALDEFADQLVAFMLRDESRIAVSDLVERDMQTGQRNGGEREVLQSVVRAGDEVDEGTIMVGYGQIYMSKTAATRHPGNVAMS
ncbi:hypothetical protein [Streptomyces sp. NPDC058653]|uniref:hypothetical protein n=1 Tax=Streptomyces sp. NPDC058653 TaxID=3346576 RepID=UPI0036518A37